jgi:hypothetical protein
MLHMSRALAGTAIALSLVGTIPAMAQDQRGPTGLLVGETPWPRMRARAPPISKTVPRSGSRSTRLSGLDYKRQFGSSKRNLSGG